MKWESYLKFFLQRKNNKIILGLLQKVKKVFYSRENYYKKVIVVITQEYK